MEFGSIAVIENDWLPSGLFLLLSSVSRRSMAPFSPHSTCQLPSCSHNKPLPDDSMAVRFDTDDMGFDCDFLVLCEWLGEAFEENVPVDLPYGHGRHVL